MASGNEPYHYNYQALDKLLKEDYDSREIGNKLDEIMSELAGYASKDEDYREKQEDHHYLLKRLRDIFWWKLPRNYSRTNRDETNH